MMNEWGIPALHLQSLAVEFARKFEAKGLRVPDLAVAGGFSTEDGVYKAMTMGSPCLAAV